MTKPRKKATEKKPAKSVSKGGFDLPIAPVVRIAKNSGAERISSSGTRAIVARTERYIATLAKEAAKSASADGRKTIKAEDVEKF
jgi:histone H3/H4